MAVAGAVTVVAGTVNAAGVAGMATAAGTVGGDPGAGTGRLAVHQTALTAASAIETPDRPAPATPRWRGPSGRSIGHTMTVPFSWELPYAWPRTPVLARNVVCTSQPLAAQAGLAMLADGGSAVDAALAAAITLTLVEPVSNGIGSDAFAIVWDGERLHGLNASGRSPAAWTPEFFHGGPVPARGWNSVTVPGAVSAWVELHARFGRLPFARLFEPAISLRTQGIPRLADGGRPVGRAGARSCARSRGSPRRSSRAEERRLQGSDSGFPEHAATLERIATTGGEAFYRGELAATMEAHSTANGGAMLAADLSAHRADWVDPISIDYRGYTLHEIPPNGQGIVALIALGILEHFDMASLPVDSADSVHLQIEAIKLAFADALAYVADVDHMPVRPDRTCCDPDYLCSARR